MFDPSAALKLLVQVDPPSVEYCTVAPDSIPVRLSTPLEVIPSLPLVPVSLDSATPGVAAVVPLTPPQSPLALWQVIPTTSPQDEATESLVHHLRDDAFDQLCRRLVGQRCRRPVVRRGRPAAGAGAHPAAAAALANARVEGCGEGV